MPDPSADITLLLGQMADGDASVAARLLPQVYDALRGIAHRQLRSERSSCEDVTNHGNPP